MPIARTRDLKSAYEGMLQRMKTAMPEEQAVRDSNGGDFDKIGPIEVGLLRFYGLEPHHHLIDVGCGSGRLALPLSAVHPGRYSGFDILGEAVTYARALVGRPDWRFEEIDHITIPEADGCADMVCFFSVLTHLLHEQSYWYLEEARRVLKPGGKIVFSFLEFREPHHWPAFMMTLEHSKGPAIDPINVFIERSAIQTWAQHLGLIVEAWRDATDPVGPEGALGQSVCVLRTP
ncbi:MAG: class I SAM-dependent methyltransferase [Acetobacteraceae bacterium]|nr:class I SAM-dependent methyltransferase [Pseudomonadota bacterium]